MSCIKVAPPIRSRKKDKGKHMTPHDFITKWRSVELKKPALRKPISSTCAACLGWTTP